VLGILAVAGGALTRRQIAEFSGVKQGTVGTILVQVEQFLDTMGHGKKARYSIYHASFGEHLVSEDNKDYIDKQDMHAQIADYYWSKFHKDWKGCDEYGLNSLAVHLFESRNSRHLNELINQKWMKVRFEKDDYTYRGFLADLNLAWRMVESMVEQDEKKLADCFRYALIQTSINSIAGSYPPELIGRALEEEVWTPKRAFSVAARVPDPGQAVKM
jgi:hypothetical protein